MKENVVQQKSFAFALSTIRIYQELQAQGEYVLSNQLLRSGTSIGANIEEAIAGQSRKDFIAKMSIACKEARETRYWLRLLQNSNLAKLDCIKPLQEIDELIRILTSIIKTTRET